MIHDLALRWLVTALFVFSAAVCVRSIVANRHSATSLVSHLLHALMAIAMAVMAWPRGAELPTRAPMIFFALAALWFAVITLRTSAHRAANGYHTLMMLAMAWMYAAMGGLPLPKAADHGMPAMPSMDAAPAHTGHTGHSGHGSHSTGHASVDAAAWPGVLNWAFTIGFGVAAVFWLYRFFAGRPGSEERGLGVLCQFAMAAGMAIMFGVML